MDRFEVGEEVANLCEEADVLLGGELPPATDKTTQKGAHEVRDDDPLRTPSSLAGVGLPETVVVAPFLRETWTK